MLVVNFSIDYNLYNKINIVFLYTKFHFVYVNIYSAYRSDVVETYIIV